MSEDIIQLPEITDVKELLTMAREDIAKEIETNPDVAPDAVLIKELMTIIDAKITKDKDFSKLALPAKIDLAAHLNFLHCLLEDFFMMDDFEEFDDEDLEEEEEE